MQKNGFAGTCRKCAAAALLAAVAACAEDNPAEGPAVAESPQPATGVVKTAASAAAKSAPFEARMAYDVRQESGVAGTVAAALNNIRQATGPALPEISEESEFGRSVLAQLDLAAAPAATETAVIGAPVNAAAPELTMAGLAGAGPLERSGLTAAAVEIQTVSAEAQPAALAQQDPNALSDEQDFAAVSSRETIESDAARRRLQIANRKVFEPADLPERQGKANVAHFALSTNHEVGSQIYDRYGTFFARFTTEEYCAEFSDDFDAQQAFLDAGGPLQDELRIDPDGDGFACGWTPYIYRSMLN